LKFWFQILLSKFSTCTATAWRGGEAEATLFARAVAPRAPQSDVPAPAAAAAAGTRTADLALAAYLVKMRALARLVPLMLPPPNQSKSSPSSPPPPSSSSSIAAAFVAKCVAHAAAGRGLSLADNRPLF
jgi:hypothetical protein